MSEPKPKSAAPSPADAAVASSSSASASMSPFASNLAATSSVPEALRVATQGTAYWIVEPCDWDESDPSGGRKARGCESSSMVVAGRSWRFELELAGECVHFSINGRDEAEGQATGAVRIFADRLLLAELELDVPFDCSIRGDEATWGFGATNPLPKMGDPKTPIGRLIVEVELAVVQPRATAPFPMLLDRPVPSDGSAPSSDPLHCASLFKALATERHSDAFLVVGDVRIPAHRFVLALQSPVFAARLDVAPKLAASLVLDSDKVSVATLRRLLHFLYSGKLEAGGKEEGGKEGKEGKAEDASASDLALLLAAHAYGIQPLVNKCAARLRLAFDPRSVLASLAVATKSGIPDLVRECCAWIGADPKRIAAVMATDAFAALDRDAIVLMLAAAYK